MKTNLYDKFKRHLPLTGIIVSVCLFILAAANYPGGTTDSPDTVGYYWAQNFISALFAPTALNGAPSRSRLFAIPSMLMLSITIGVLCMRIRANATSPMDKNALQIGGIGTMIYTFLIVTPMHNMMINFTLPFAFAVLFALLHLLYASRRWLLFLSGVVSIMLLLLTALMYYETWLYAYLPLMQKVSLMACVGWLLAVYYAVGNPVPQVSTMPNKTIADNPYHRQV